MLFESGDFFIIPLKLFHSDIFDSNWNKIWNSMNGDGTFAYSEFLGSIAIKEVDT